MRRKYSNQPTVVDGLQFASKREASRYSVLRMLERAKRISDLRTQVPYELAPAVKLNGRRKPALRYVADFVYRDEAGQLVVEDVKAVRTTAYRIKQHLMATVHGIEITEI